MTIKVHQTILGQGKTIVLVHGWAMHGGIWRRFAESLAQHYRVICVDLPGHGHSDPVRPFSLERISSILADAVEEKRCCWLGWSLGATVVLDLAYRFPERVDCVVLMAGNPLFTRSYFSPLNDPMHPGPWPGMDRRLLHSFADRFSKNPEAALINFLALQVHGLPEAKALLRELKASVNACPMPNIETLRDGLMLLEKSDLRPVLSNLKIPALAILGSKDTLVPVAVSRKMQSLQPNLSVTVIDGAGHVPFLTHELTLAQAIGQFMERT